MSANKCPKCGREIPINEMGSRFCYDCVVNVGEFWKAEQAKQARQADQQIRGAQLAKNRVVPRPHRVDDAGVPLELHRWSWPAFIFGWLWCFFNNLPVWGIASLLGWLLTWGFAGFIIDIVLGAKGNEYAWKAKSYMNADDYWRSQRGWQIAIWVFAALVVVVTYIAVSWSQFSNAVNNYP